MSYGEFSHRHYIDSNEIPKHLAELMCRLGIRKGTSRGNYNKQYAISSLGVPDSLIPRHPFRASVKNLSVAVGSSTTKENLPDDSFAGDQNFTSALWVKTLSWMLVDDPRRHSSPTGLSIINK